MTPAPSPETLAVRAPRRHSITPTVLLSGAIAAEEHRQLLGAALKRDAKSAQEVLRKHVRGGIEHGLTA